MPDLDQLDRLAPEVDLAASLALFDERRSRHRRRRRSTFVGIAAALVLVAAIGIGALTTIDRDTDLRVGGAGDPFAGPSEPDQPRVSEPVPQGAVVFGVLAMRPATEPMGTLRAATDEASVAELWSATGFGADPTAGEVPTAVYLQQHVVVSITIPDDACPPDLASFTRDGEVITPVFVEVQDACFKPLVPKTYLVGIERASVTPRFTLVLPGQQMYGFGEQRLEVVLAPTGNEVEPGTGGEVLGAFPLPPIGEARSHLLVDGTPIWVVHHADGTASAVPAVTRVEGVDELADSTGRWTLVRWSPLGWFVGGARWDAWGRAVDGPEHAGEPTVPFRAGDLVGYAADIGGDEVVVRRSTVTDIDGDATPPPALPGRDEVSPVLPPLIGVETAPLPDGVELPVGWVQIQGDLVGADDRFRICDSGYDVVAGGPIPLCPDSSRPVSGFATHPGGRWLVTGPLLVRTGADGRIDAVVAVGPSGPIRSAGS